MPLYHNKNPHALIRSIEIEPAGDGGAYSVFHLRKGGDRAALQALLAAPGIGQEVLAETRMHNQTLLVTRGTSKPDALLAAFAGHGDAFVPPVVEKKFNPWKWRGITSIVGQSLQLVSSFTSSKPGADRAGIASFAISNLIANVTNITFGAQEKADPHQLRVIKKHINDEFGKHLPDGQDTISPDKDCSARRADGKEEAGLGKKAHALIQQYSVSGGEIGLRLFGAASLSYPVTKWGEGFRKLKSGSFREAHKAAKNDVNEVTYKVGLITLLGKFISLGSIEPDPYHPTPPTLLDKFRENVTFRLSSVVEGVGAAWMAHDRLTKQKFKFRGKEYRDYFGGVGNLVFIAGYVIRFFAPYGSREVDSKELHAHITDTLAKMPREKVPQLLAEIAVDLKEHFKEKAPDIAVIYSQLASELKQYYKIDMHAVPAPTEQTAAPSAQKYAGASPAARYQDKINTPGELVPGLPG